MSDGSDSVASGYVNSVVISSQTGGSGGPETTDDQPCSGGPSGELLNIIGGMWQGAVGTRWMLWDPPPGGHWRSGVGVSAHHREQTPGPVRVQLALRLVVEDGL